MDEPSLTISLANIDECCSASVGPSLTDAHFVLHTNSLCPLKSRKDEFGQLDYTLMCSLLIKMAANSDSNPQFIL